MSFVPRSVLVPVLALACAALGACSLLPARSSIGSEECRNRIGSAEDAFTKPTARAARTSADIRGIYSCVSKQGDSHYVDVVDTGAAVQFAVKSPRGETLETFEGVPDGDRIHVRNGNLRNSDGMWAGVVVPSEDGSTYELQRSRTQQGFCSIDAVITCQRRI